MPANGNICKFSPLSGQLASWFGVSFQQFKYITIQESLSLYYDQENNLLEYDIKIHTLKVFQLVYVNKSCAEYKASNIKNKGKNKIK